MRLTVQSLKNWRLAGIGLLLLACAATTAQGVDWVLLVDNTGTMRYGGRGEATLEGIREFVALAEPGDRVSILSYGESVLCALQSSPVTIVDDASRDGVVSSLGFAFNADRTDMTAGLDRVWQERRALVPGAVAGEGTDAVVVLLTDGKLIPVYDDYSRYDQIYAASRRHLLELASLLGEQGVRVCTIALGREEKVDGDLMKEVARRSGGSYHHVDVPTDVLEAFRAISAGSRSETVVESDGRQPAEEAPVTPATGRGFTIQDVAHAGGAAAPQGVASGSVTKNRPSLMSCMTVFPSDFCLATAGVLAVFIGLVAVGTEKRQRWAGKLSGALFGTGERRVRGYLKPVDPPGIASARANIGLENPGVDSIKVGNGTSLLAHLDATVEFVGTTDRTAPTMVVECGQVAVEGEATTRRKLRDGDIVDIDGLRYQYLRGNRR
jgi:hypothetical protein